jgi:hypothetical protein
LGANECRKTEGEREELKKMRGGTLLTRRKKRKERGEE